MREARDQAIISTYYNDLISMEEVGKRFNISREGVRLILKKHGYDDRHYGPRSRQTLQVCGFCSVIFYAPPKSRKHPGYCSTACKLDDSKGAHAYRARADRQLSWKAVTDQFDFGHTSNAIQSARRYAHRAEKPWPIRCHRVTD